MAGKKAGPKSPSKAAPVAANVSADAQKKLNELKAEGNHAFARGDYAKAIGTYDDAIKLLPDTPDKAELINNKAACYIALKRYKEAVKECTSALDVAPNMANALKRRAKAYEHQGLYKQALADMQAVNRTDAASDDTRAAEKRLKDQLTGRGSASGASLATAPARGSSALSAANGSAAARGASGRVPGLANTTFAAKLSLGDETKLLHITATTSYAELLSAAQAKFPNAGPIVLRYVDKEGDLVTLTCRADLQQAIGELLLANRNHISAGPHGPKLQNLPPIKISVATVASEADVPKPPLEEEMERQQQAYLRAQQLQAKARKDGELVQQAAQQAAAAAGQQAGQGEEYHVDPWLLEFASLFREMTGVAPDQHVEPHNLGWEALTKGMEATLHHEKALPLLDKATESFKEVTCLGLMNWGNVHQVKGQRLVEEAGRAGKQLSEVEEAVFIEFAEAERRYKEALAYKDDFFEGVCAMAQLAFERAKVKTGVVVQPAKAPEEGAEPKTAEQLSADQHAALSEALAKLTVAGLDSAESYFTQAVEWVDKAIAVAPALDAKRTEAQAAAKEAGKAAAEGAQQQPEYSYGEQAQVMKGNFLYEWSQLVAAVKPDAWRPILDQAAELFRKAGCPEKDVRGALKNHYKRDLIDLGPEPEEPAPAAAAAPAAEKKEEAAAPEKPAPAAKGLPSLEVKKKAAAKAAAE